jgi:hypothetical protein
LLRNGDVNKYGGKSCKSVKLDVHMPDIFIRLFIRWAYMKAKKPLKIILFLILIIIGLMLICETALRILIEYPLKTSFYGSVSKEEVKPMQAEYGVKVSNGYGWAHLGWIADPDGETYRVEEYRGGKWDTAGNAEYGSFLIKRGGRYRVIGIPKKAVTGHLIGEAEIEVLAGEAPVFKPEIAGGWKTLFKPSIYGDYINDHTVYRDNEGNWRLLGITSKTNGDYSREKYFASAVCREFPPREGMREEKPVADFGELAWAPHVIEEGGIYYIFWSPHRLQRMTSRDGISWENRETVINKPFHKFFRDAMIIKVAEGQWLLYTTARGLFFSRVDVYQSFDLKGWQYIGPALGTSWGSERNSPFASTESPFVIEYKGGYYLSITYNNDTAFWNGLLLPLKIWLDKASYNDTLVFHSDNPYYFGCYKGMKKTPSLIARLKAHAPEYVNVPEKDEWYITTCGWPWVSSITKGEAAVAPIAWRKIKK